MRVASKPAALILAAVLLAAVSPAAASVDLDHLPRLKQMQVRTLMSEPMAARKQRVREIAAAYRDAKRAGQPLPPRALTRRRAARPDEDATRAGTATAARAAGRLAASASPVGNVRANNPAGEGSSVGQCETHIVAWNQFVIAAWNDGQAFVTGGSGQGYAVSTDGGATFTDMGDFPKPGSGTHPNWEWTSDPVLAVNEKTGTFYFTALADWGPSSGTENSAVGIIKGRFVGNVITWETPRVIRSVSASNDFIDKQWVVADSSNGRVYLSYTRFPATGARIETQSADSNATTWSSALEVSVANNSERGFVQGSRPIVSGNGTVYIQYYLIGPVDVDFLKVARSTNNGTSYGAAVVAASYYTNWGSGAPGFNRDRGVQFAGFAVDRSHGPRRGRLYLTYPESVNFYDDAPSAGGTVVNAGAANNVFAQAVTFTPDNTLSGSVTSSTTDWDYFKVAMTAGQTLYLETASSTTGYTLRVFAPDTVQRMAFVAPTSGSERLLLFSAPAAGTYYVRVAGTGGLGTYQVRTALVDRDSEPGTDVRDVMVVSSADGITWGAPVRVDDAPTGHDGWLPEVAVSADGRAYVCWYDWRDSPAGTGGGRSHVYLARSDDGGAAWNSLGMTTTTQSLWSPPLAASNIQPNQGDYNGLFANHSAVYVVWSDDRGGNPDAYVAVWPLALTPTQVSLVASSASPDAVALEWYVDAAPGWSAELERRTGTDGVWGSLGLLLPEGEGRLAYRDTDVEAGGLYQYRLAVTENGVTTRHAETTVRVPAGLALALGGAQPNPAAGALTVAFSLPSAEPASLELLDLAGRAVSRREVGTQGAGRHIMVFEEAGSLRPGVYVVRLTQAGVTRSQRVSLVR